MNLYEIITTQQDPQLANSLEEFVKQNLPEFKEIFHLHLLKKFSFGCISVGEAFWLYYLVKAINPKIVIESGTYEGYSLYFLRRAVPLRLQCRDHRRLLQLSLP